MVHNILFIRVPSKCIMTLQKVYWWDGLNRDIAEFVAKCLNFQKVKVMHRKVSALTQTMEFRILKWKKINMDFVIGLH